ncbi:MAG: hypothetical protein PVF49_02280 [Anaerolineales bacterium]
MAASAEELAHWQEYQSALGDHLLHSSAPNVLCEWEILGREDRIVYVLTICMGIETIGDVNPGHPTIRIPAVIHLTESGGVAGVEMPGGGNHYAQDIRNLFPVDVQEIIFDGSVYQSLLQNHLRWRLDQPDEPPLIALDATPDS